MKTSNNIAQVLSALGLSSLNQGTFPASRDLPKDFLPSISPINNQELARVGLSTAADYQRVLAASQEAFKFWREVPAPKRGALVYDLGCELRQVKRELGALITWETGKICAEGEGEVQEMIDIADFAVGLSRQLYGKSMHSERPQHRMYEQWHPLGCVGVITAFNFPAAVWAWNAMIAAVCGNSVIWKPSPLTPLTAVAISHICQRVARAHQVEALFSLLTDEDGAHGRSLASDPQVPLISATGSCRMGASVAQATAARFGRSLLELGGNNAVIISEDANLQLAVRAVTFAAVGTAGQRCTTTRRLFVQRKIFADFVSRLASSYQKIRLGNPFDVDVLCGPLINQQAVERYTQAVKTALEQGATLVCGGKLVPDLGSSLYVQPTLFTVPAPIPLMREETFAPILFIVAYDDLAQAISWQNEVPQGLSSAIFTSNVSAAERFLSALGSDCGIANVNIGTSGAEIGGAFGGEKETGGGREAGSDSWKAYMRRQTVTINWGEELPLAQGVEFG